MLYFDLIQPETGFVYRLAHRRLTIPGFPRVDERILIPMEVGADGPYPMVTATRPILSALPLGFQPMPLGPTRNWLLDNGWKPHG